VGGCGGGGAVFGIGCSLFGVGAGRLLVVGWSLFGVVVRREGGGGIFGGWGVGVVAPFSFYCSDSFVQSVLGARGGGCLRVAEGAWGKIRGGCDMIVGRSVVFVFDDRGGLGGQGGGGRVVVGGVVGI